ncbi:MAG TPA: uracil-DNA glycosylase [Longimicrobiales bacterium]|nr:uracil-DNA glycosylase [Longimicrobiales bacterium]
MSEEANPGREVARLLRQQAEIGGSDLFLDQLTRVEALEFAREGRAARAGRVATPDPVAASMGREVPKKTAAALPVLPATYEALKQEALACTRCGLAETRTQVVFSDGAVDARLVVVGEAPGANEDATGLPFVGAAGQFLDLLLATVGLSREDSVYICNVLKCRPPGNRNPQSDEIAACSPFLEKQLELIAPRALLAVGTFSGQLLTGEQKPLGKLRGEVHSYQGIPLVVTYHPAALLRNAGWTRAFWDDLQLLRTVMDGA